MHDNERRSHNRKLALHLAKNGFAVFPSVDKVPLPIAWQKLDTSLGEDDKQAEIQSWRARHGHDADRLPAYVGSTKSIDVVNMLWKKYPDAVPSISLGPSGLYVLDADIDANRNGPNLLRAKLSELEVDISQCPITKTQSGAEHIYFDNSQAMPSRVSDALDALYVQGKGVGNQVVAPGAIREDGKIYKSHPDHPSLTEAFVGKLIPPIPAQVSSMVMSGNAKTITVDGSTEALLIAQLRSDVWPDGAELFDQLDGKFDLEKMMKADESFKNAWTGETTNTSDALLHILQGLRREYGENFTLLDAAAILAMDDCLAVQSCTGDTRKTPGTGEYDYRDIARAFDKARTQFPNAIGKALAVAADNDDYGSDNTPEHFLNDKMLKAEAKAEKQSLANKLKNGTLLRKFSDFANEYRPLLYVIEGIVVSAGQYTITARTGHGKTVFLSSTAIAVAAGRQDILGVETPPGLVIYFTFENPDDFRMKIMAAVKAHKADAKMLDENLMIADARLKPEDIQKLLRTLKRDIALIVIDTFQAAFDGDDFNDNNAVLKFAQRLRPMTQDRGFPAMLIATHPVKNALQDNLLPYGGGALLNEVDGNLCLWKDERTNVTTLHWQGKFRGREFSPIQFAISSSSSPDILDAKGVEVPLPVLKLVTDDMAEEAERKGVSRSVEVLKAMMADKGGSQRSWGLATGLAHAQVGRELAKLQKDKLVTQTLGGWSVTTKGEKEVVTVTGALDASGVFGAVDDETY